MYNVFCNLILISLLNFRALSIKTYLFPTKIPFKQSLPECILFPPDPPPSILLLCLPLPPFPLIVARFGGGEICQFCWGGNSMFEGVSRGNYWGGTGYVLGGFRGEREFRGGNEGEKSYRYLESCHYSRGELLIYFLKNIM